MLLRALVSEKNRMPDEATIIYSRSIWKSFQIYHYLSFISLAIKTKDVETFE